MTLDKHQLDAKVTDEMSKQTTVATNLVGRQVVLNPENMAAGKRYTEAVYQDNKPLPWLSLYPGGGEVMAVYQDSDKTLMLCISTKDRLVNIPADWMTVKD